MSLGIDDILRSHITGRPVVMGILNVTPDSFSDGGTFLDADAAARHALDMVAAGAHVIDVGAESTRPGSRRVSADEQIDRLRDILPAVVSAGVPVSIDTTLAPVAEFALDAGARIVNDVSAGRDDPDLLTLVAQRDAALVLMHMLGEPKTMQAEPHYDDVTAEVRDFLAERLEAAVAAGVPRARCMVDPGIGFGKTLEHNLLLLARGVDVLVTLDVPVLIGSSRKRFIGALSGEPEPTQRIGGTIAACLAARRRGATVFRVHDVSPVAQALAVHDAIETPPLA
ncbi:MAG: dihydropteroate synthase [Phycisphaerae bacterium]